MAPHRSGDAEVTQYNFGQPTNGIIQVAYTVADIARAMTDFTRRLNIGPWFLIEHFPARDMRYRDAPTDLDITLAMGFSGQMIFELIQQHNDVPSVYRDVIDKRGFGFHHWGVGTTNFDQDVKRYVGMGYETAFSAITPVGDRVAYMDATADLPGMVELIEMGDVTEKLFTGFYQASIGWDGNDPVRKVV